MGFSHWDKILIKNLHDWKGYWGYGAKKLSKEFPLRSWSKRELMQRHVYQRQIHSVDELKWQLIDVWCGFEQLIFWRGYWPVARKTERIRAKGGACELAMLNFVRICYI